VCRIVAAGPARRFFGSFQVGSGAFPLPAIPLQDIVSKVASGLATACADVSFVPADLSQPGAVKALVATIERQRRGIDLLASNVGGLLPSTLVVDEGRAAT